MLALALPGGSVSGQDFPARPIRLVVGGAVGGGWDLASRVLAEQMQEALGQPVIVDNKPGADGIVAAKLAARAAPDGYTLMPAVSAQMTMNPVLHDKLPYDPVRDFEPVSMIGLYPLVLVTNATLPMGSVLELIARAKAHPGQLNAGTGSSGFLFATELFKQMSGTDIRPIPYKGSAQVVAALLAGDVQMAFVDIAPAVAHIRSGRLKGLAVTTSRRVPFLAEVPTLDEAGVPGYELVLWIGMFAPAGTPKDIVARLHAAIARSVESAEVQAKLTTSGIIPVASTPQSLGASVRREIGLYGGMAKSPRISAD